RYAQGDVAQAEQLYGEALVMAEQAGDPNYMTYTACGLAEIAFIVGDWCRAGAQLGRTLLATQESPLSMYSCWPLAAWGRQRLVEGERERGVTALEEVLTRGAGEVDPQVLLCAEQALAELDLLEGRAATARARLDPYSSLLTLTDAHLAW